MSYWSHNPELFDDIIYQRLLATGLASAEDTRPVYEIVYEYLDSTPNSWRLVDKAIADYWAGLADCYQKDR